MFFFYAQLWHLTNVHPLYRGTGKHLHFIFMCTHFTNNILFSIINAIYTVCSTFGTVWHLWRPMVQLLSLQTLTLILRSLIGQSASVTKHAEVPHVWKHSAAHQSASPFWSAPRWRYFVSGTCWTSLRCERYVPYDVSNRLNEVIC